MSSIDCVLVTYCPDVDVLSRVLESIVGQVRWCYVINNGSEDLKFSYANVVGIPLGRNTGIAFAQNHGIRLALGNQADFVLLSDQDTIFPSDYVANLLSRYDRSSGDWKIGAIVPLFFNTVRGSVEKVALTKFYSVQPRETADKCMLAEHAISSGSMIPASAFSTVGLMNDRLFIDYVDFEWCWRAKKAGLVILVATDIEIVHSLGDTAKLVLGKKYTLRSSVRYYYMIRNAVYLAYQGFPLAWFERILFWKRIASMISGVLVLEKNRFGKIFLIFAAVRNGILGKLGPAT